MLRRALFALVVGTLAVGAAVAADPIKLAVKDFKVKSSFDGGENLITAYEDEGKIVFAVNGTATAEVKVPEDGDYVIVVEASCDDAKNEKAKIKITVGEVVVHKSFELTSTDQKEYKFDAKLKKGPAKLVIEFLNDEYKENEFDRNFTLHSARIEAKEKK